MDTPRPAATGRGVVVVQIGVRTGRRDDTTDRDPALDRMPPAMRARALRRLAAARRAYDTHLAHMRALRAAGVL